MTLTGPAALQDEAAHAAPSPHLAVAPEPASPPPLSLRGVDKSWEHRVILRDVHLTLAAGQAAWIGGRNGVGKTTLLRIAAGLIRPGSGTVRLLGIDPERERRAFQRRLGMLAAGDRGLYPRLSGFRHLELWAALALLSRRERAAAITAAIERFELDDFAHRRVDRLSLGQRQRLRLAMTFLHRPSVVLLDEPRNSLDEEGVGTLRSEVVELLARGGAVIWCSPAGDRLDFHFDQRYVLEDGRLVDA